MERIGRTLGFVTGGGERGGPSPRLWIAAGAGVVVVVAAAVTAGLMWGSGAPAVKAGEADTYAAAPACSAVPRDAVRSLVPGAALEANEQGPMTDADSSTCVWTSLGSNEAPRSLHLDFTAHFTDKSGDISGSRAADRRLEELAPIGGLEGSEPAPALGDGALTWSGTDEDTSSKAVFRRDNMLVEVFYGGDTDGAGGGLTREAARDGAVTIAEQVAASL